MISYKSQLLSPADIKHSKFSVMIHSKEVSREMASKLSYQGDSSLKSY